MIELRLPSKQRHLFYFDLTNKPPPPPNNTKWQQNIMENVKTQTFTEEQLVQNVKSTYDENIRQYSRLTNSKKHRQEPSAEASDVLSNEPHTIENVALN